MGDERQNGVIDLSRLMEQCREGDPRTQIRAMMALERASAYSATGVILPLLASDDAGVRSAAADALGCLGSERIADVGPALEECLDDPDDLVRGGAAQSLGVLHYMPARPALEHVLLHDPDWVVRASAAEALGDLGDAGAVTALSTALGDQATPVRSYAALAIGLVGETAQRAMIRDQLAAETAPAVRCELLIAALRCGDESAFAELLALLDTADDDVSIELGNALEDMLSRKTPAVVISRAKELEPKLARLGGDELSERLAELVGNSANE